MSDGATLVDTHAHLDAPELIGEIDSVIARAQACGVTRIVTIGATGRGVDAAAEAVAIAERYPNVWATVGVHPLSADSNRDLGKLETLAAHPRVVAIGETGLDCYHQGPALVDQEWWFREQIALARKVRKPIVIHSREAGERCFEILKECRAAEVGGVFHCFAEDAAFAARLRDMQFLVSVTGVLTFKKNERTREIFSAIPLEQVMVETDAPYLSPEPHRGKRCESAFVTHTARKLAEITGRSFEEIARITTRNAERLFRLPAETTTG